MPKDRVLPLWAGRTAALLTILLVALNLRTVVAALSPILNLVEREIPLSPIVVGVIGAAPPLMFALAGLITPGLSRRFDLEKLLLVAIVVMVVGQFARALAPEASVLIASTALALLGAGIGNVLIPPLVKRYFSDRMTQLTSLYAVLIAIGSSLPALAAVPVASQLGWRASLVVWGALGLVAVVPTIVASRSRAGKMRRARASADGDTLEPDERLEATLFRSPVAWAIMLTFTISSINVYAYFAWLPSLLVDTAGVSRGTAGSLLALYAIIGVPSALIVPVLASRLKNVGILIYFAAACLVISDAGLLFAPAGPTPLWVVLGGLGPLLFPLSLLLINRRTRTQPGAVALSGFVQGVGYIVAAASPLAFGVLHQVSGGWTLSILLMVVVTLAAVPAAIILRRYGYLEDDLAARARAG